jgi:replication factor A1
VVDKYYDLLQVGQVYYVSGGQVKISNPKFNNLANAYEITLEGSSNIAPCHEAASSVPTVKFSFIPINLIAESDKDAFVDVIGVVHETHELGSVTAKATGKVLSKRDLVLVDCSKHSVRVTLWGKEAEDFVDLGTHPVLALKQVRIGEYMGAKTLSTQRASSLLLNPDIREAHELRGWYDTVGHAEAPTNVSSVQKTTGHVDERKLIAQIKDESLGMGEKGDFVSLVATIAYIKSDANVSYPACTSEGCNKKVVETGPAMWSCERCQKVLDHCDHRYIMSLQIADESGQTWVNAFNETGAAILGVSANDLYRLAQEDQDAYKKVFEDAQFRTFLFRLKIKQETYNGESKIKNTIMTALPLNYPDESARLADKIQQML